MIKPILTFLILLLSNEGMALWEDWEQKDKTLWKSYVALNVVDTLQTFDLINKQNDQTYEHSGHLRETNPLLGSNPRKGEVVILKLVSNAIAYKILDNNPQARTVTLSIMNGIYIKTVTNNHEIGLRLTYQFK